MSHAYSCYDIETPFTWRGVAPRTEDANYFWDSGWVAGSQRPNSTEVFYGFSHDIFCDIFDDAKEAQYLQAHGNNFLRGR